MTKRFGFTLAEVLITLGIIGVVAAMTIPTLMNQTGQAEFKTGFKKMMSTLNQAVTMNVALDDTDFSVTTADNSTAVGTAVSISNILQNRMNVLSATTGTADGANMMGTTSGTASNITLFFNDGMAITMKSDSKTCTEANPCKAKVDVNGRKNPNILANCSNSRTATTDAGVSGGTSCTDDNIIVGDQFSVLLRDQQVVPNGAAARYVMFK